MTRTHLLFAGLAAALVAQPACRPSKSPQPPDTSRAELAPTPGVPWFVDVSGAAGVTFRHFDSATPQHYIPEVMGSGVGWIDYDVDGWPDLFCVQDGPLRPGGHAGQRPTHKLYRNNRDGTFADVTDAAGLNKSGYGMGCAVGDFDNDGFDDLVVTYFGHTSLYANRTDGKGGRRFDDVTTAAKIHNPHWGTSCGWGDVDGDGFLDLYVCNYVTIDLDRYTPCENSDVNQVYVCPPTVFPAAPHKLFRNNRDGTFTDVSDASGVGRAAPGAGLGVALLDFDGDGMLDIYAANDMRPAHLFRNRGDGTFEEKGILSGAALMPGGRFMAGMGVAVGDLDSSGRASLVVANYQDEPNMVFLNRGKMSFKEWSHPSGLGGPSLKRLAFGIDLFDADLDGHLDVAVANGHVVRNSMAIFKAPYEQEAQLFVGDGTAHFKEVSEKAGSYFREKLVGRGVAVCDFDNDGKPDLALSHNAGPLKLLRNATASDNRSVRLTLVGDGKMTNRNAVGARVEVEAGGAKLVRFVHGGGSYLSASDYRLVVGLGAAGKADRVAVTWPNGQRQEFRDLDAGRGWRLVQGKDKPENEPNRK